MKQLLLVFVGGGFGSVLRYLIGKQFTSNSFQFSWGTFSANLIGSFIIGLVLGYVLVKHKISNELLLFLVAGFCGGFTTFSTFANESLSYLRSGQTKLFFTYVVSSLVFGLLCVWLGYSISAKLFSIT